MKVLHLIKVVSGRVLIVGALLLSPIAFWAQDYLPDRIARLNYGVDDVRSGQVGADLLAITSIGIFRA
jgi:hypothetical protein